MRKLINFESGLKLVLVQNTAVRSVAAGVFVAAGAVTESPELSGISHFIEHMVFKGTKSRSSFDIVNEIDSIGAQINAFTTKSYTCFYTVSVDTNAAKCIDVLSDIYFDPTFDEKELKKERRVIFEEINESEDTPDDLCIEQLSTQFFKGHPLEKPILGTKQTLNAMNGETLKKYKDEFYTPSDTVLCLAGNITEKQAVAFAEKYFESKYENKTSSKREEVSQAALNSGLIVRKKKIEQAHIAFAFPSYAYNDEKLVRVQLLTSIFGSEMSSRLFQSVREKLGLCYTVVGYPSTYENNGAFIIYTSVRPANAEKAVTAIRREIDLLLNEGVTDAELAKGKEQLKASMVLGQESTSAMMRTFGRHAVQTGELYDFDSRIAAIDAVTKEDILSAANYVFDFAKVAASLVAGSTKIDILSVMKKI